MALFCCLVSCKPEPKFYNVTFNSNGAEGVGPDAVVVAEGSSIVLPSGEGLTNGELVFVGWNTQQDGSGASYSESESFVVSFNVILYAMWTDDVLVYSYDDNFGAYVVTGFKADVPDEGKMNVRIPSSLKDGKPVKSIGKEAFLDCKMLESIVIPTGVVSIGDSAFKLCKNIKSVSIPDGLENIGDFAFASCSNLESIVIPNGVRNIGKNAFYGCNLLKEIVIPASVTSIGNSAFAFCNKLASLKVDSGNRAYYVEGNCLMEKASKKLVRGCGDIRVPVDTKIIGPNAFSGLVSLTQIGIPEGVERICNEAFSGCVELEEAVIPSSVTSLEMSAFAACKKLVEITIPSKVTSIGLAAFSDCSNLKEVLISEGVGSIGDHAFSGCTNLEKITIPASVTSIGSFALYNASLEIYYGGNEAMWKNCKPKDDYISYKRIVEYNYHPQA